MGKWTASSSGHWTFSPYLEGNDNPNMPPTGTMVGPGGPYSSPVDSSVSLDTNLAASPIKGGAPQQIVDWTKLGAKSPYANFGSPAGNMTGSPNILGTTPTGDSPRGAIGAAGASMLPPSPGTVPPGGPSTSGGRTGRDAGPIAGRGQGLIGMAGTTMIPGSEDDRLRRQNQGY